MRHTAIIAAAMAIAGCAARSAPLPSPPKAAAAPPEAAASPREREQKAEMAAQRAWCGYLKALYLRADQYAKEWPRFDECVRVQSTAAPLLLTQTAECSLRALDAFVGDPFSSAYANEVSRCGTTALETTIASRAEVEPFIDDVCHRAVACGQLDPAECRGTFEGTLEVSLQRAVGAMNRGGRDELHRCLRGSACADLKGRVPTCLEPLMDRLLWLPLEG